MNKTDSLSWREKLPLILRWKLKYSLGFKDERARKASFWLYWKLCPSLPQTERGEAGKILRREGIEVVQHNTPPQRIAEWNRLIDAQHDDDSQWLVSTEYGTLEQRSQPRKDNCPSEHFSGLPRHFSAPEIVKIAEEHFGESLRAYYGCHYRILSFDCYLTHPYGKKPAEASFRWHTDDHPAGLIKGFIYLKDVGREQGPFCGLAGTHRLSLDQYIDKSAGTDGRYLNDTPERLGLEPSYVTGPAGTAFLANANSVHRATPLIEGERRVFCFMFLPSMRPPLEEMALRAPVPTENAPDRIHEPVW